MPENEKSITLRIEKIAHGGVCIARHQGRVIFVTGAIPGELVEAALTEDKEQAYGRATVTEVIEPSPDRVEHFWRAARQGAGGAEFGHIKLARQRMLKTEVLRESLQRMAKIDSEIEVEALPGDDELDGLHYRTRIQLNVDEEGTAGPVRERTHEVIFTKKLPLAVPEIEELGLHLQNWKGARKLFIAASSTGQTQYQVDKKTFGSQQLVERVRDRTFRLSAGAFWQVHKAAPKALSDQVIEYLKLLSFEPKEKNLDLYAGVGLFSATAAQEFAGANFLAVESHAAAVADGKRSAVDLGNLRFQRSDVLQFLRAAAKQKGEFDTVILDPPRSGAAGKVMNLLGEMAPRNIVYVACDPVALARDLETLMPYGYRLKAMRSLDLFPQTHHFETLVALTKVA